MGEATSQVVAVFSRAATESGCNAWIVIKAGARSAGCPPSHGDHHRGVGNGRMGAGGRCRRRVRICRAKRAPIMPCVAMGRSCAKQPPQRDDDAVRVTGSRPAGRCPIAYAALQHVMGHRQRALIGALRVDIQLVVVVGCAQHGKHR